MRIIGRRRNGDTSSAPEVVARELEKSSQFPLKAKKMNVPKPGIGVAQLVGHVLEVIRIQTVVVPKHLSVRLF